MSAAQLALLNPKFNTKAEQCMCLFSMQASEQLGFTWEVEWMAPCNVFLLHHVTRTSQLGPSCLPIAVCE